MAPQHKHGKRRKGERTSLNPKGEKQHFSAEATTWVVARSAVPGKGSHSHPHLAAKMHKAQNPLDSLPLPPAPHNTPHYKGNLMGAGPVFLLLYLFPCPEQGLECL